MYDVMLDEAKLWFDESTQRERKLESTLHAPPAPVKHEYEAYSSEEDEMDPVEEAKYYQQIRDTDGFDVDFCYHPFGGIMPCGWNVTDIPLAKLGLHCYNIDKGTNLQYKTINKLMAQALSFVDYYITLEAMDPDNNSLVTFQTCIWDSATQNGERLRLITKQCRIKPQVSDMRNPEADCSLWLWDEDAVDEFYTTEMPEWLQADDALTGDKKLQFHEVNESELQENEWLNLYAEIALTSERPSELEYYVPLEIKKVVVQTKEDVESSMKLKSSNAIFYMSFVAHGRGGLECRAIIRQTRDGKPGHMCLEAKCMMGK